MFWERTTSEEKARIMSFASFFLCMVLLFERTGNIRYLTFAEESLYFKVTILIANGSFWTPFELYSDFSPGYPLLAVPFYIVFTQLGALPTFGHRILSMVCYSSTVYLTYKLGKLLYNEKLGFLSSFLFAFGTFAIEYGLKVWVHAPSAFFATLSIYSIFLYGKNTEAKHLLISSASMLVGFLIRYTNLLLAIPILLYLFKVLFDEKESLKNVLLIFLFCITFIGPMLFLNYFLYGNILKVGYQSVGPLPHVFRYGLHVLRDHFTRLPGLTALHIYSSLIDHRYLFYSKPCYSSLIQSSPFFVLSVPGFIYLYKIKRIEIVSMFMFCILILITYPGRYWLTGWFFNMRWATVLLPIFSLASGMTLIKITEKQRIEINFVKGMSFSIITTLMFMIIGLNLIDFLYDLVTFDKYLYGGYRTPINTLNLFLALLTAILFVLYKISYYITTNYKIESYIFGACIGAVFMGFIGAIVNNIVINCVGAPFGLHGTEPGSYLVYGFRVFPFLDIIGNSFFLGKYDVVPGNPLYRNFLKIPIVYWLPLLISFSYLLFKILKIYLGPIILKNQPIEEINRLFGTYSNIGSFSIILLILILISLKGTPFFPTFSFIILPIIAVSLVLLSINCYNLLKIRLEL